MKLLILAVAIVVVVAGLRHVCKRVINWCECGSCTTNPDDQYTWERMNGAENDEHVIF
jgi:hypothetical protein